MVQLYLTQSVINVWNMLGYLHVDLRHPAAARHTCRYLRYMERQSGQTTKPPVTYLEKVTLKLRYPLFQLAAVCRHCCITYICQKALHWSRSQLPSDICVVTIMQTICSQWPTDFHA